MQTPFGKGVVREAGNSGRLTVEIRDRSLVLDEGTVTPLNPPKATGRKKQASVRAPGTRARARPVVDVDLHGLTVEEALARAEQALNDALLADLPGLRLIHGKSGGRIRAALHRRLSDIPTVRAFRLEPGNPGVTIVTL